MKIILHRGNRDGSSIDTENKPSIIDEGIDRGYDIEVDVWHHEGGLWLGHDIPQYKIDHNWIEERKEYLWIHCKNLNAAKECWKYQAFCHDNDDYTYTSTGKIWMHPSYYNSLLKEDKIDFIDESTIIPLMTLHYRIVGNPYAVFTDYPSLLK